MKKNLLFIGATHGDEPIGVSVLTELAGRRSDFDWIIGNEPALNQGRREFEGDLNRSAPGNLSSERYAVRRAGEIVELSHDYKYTIDLHGTSKNTGIFIIITNPTLKNLQLATLFDIDRIVIWPSFSPELEGPLSEYFPCGLEIECGERDDPAIARELSNILTDFLDNLENRRQPNFESAIENRTIYQVYGTVFASDDVEPDLLAEFQETNLGGMNFTPLLIGSYDEIICYKMRKISWKQALSLD